MRVEDKGRHMGHGLKNSDFLNLGTNHTYPTEPSGFGQRSVTHKTIRGLHRENKPDSENLSRFLAVPYVISSTVPALMPNFSATFTSFIKTSRYPLLLMRASGCFEEPCS